MDKYGINEKVDSHEISLFDNCALSYGIWENGSFSRPGFFDPRFKEYTSFIRAVFDGREGIYVVKSCYKELRRFVSSLKRLPYMLEKHHGCAKEMESMAWAIKNGHILRLPREDEELKEELWSGLFQYENMYGLSETDFDTMLSSIVIAHSIGSVALFTDDGSLINACKSGRKRLLKVRGLELKHGLDVYTRLHNGERFEEEVV